jgi:hypothetical protein
MGNKINTYGSILDQVIGTKLNKFLAPQQNQGGLLNFVKSPYASDIGMGLLAQSGYSTMPTSLGQSLGVAMNQANQLRSQRRANDIAELGTLVNLRGALQDPERKIIQGADGFQYYADTMERVLPNVKAPPPEYKSSDFFNMVNPNTKEKKTINLNNPDDIAFLNSSDSDGFVKATVESTTSDLKDIDQTKERKFLETYEATNNIVRSLGEFKDQVKLDTVTTGSFAGGINRTVSNIKTELNDLRLTFVKDNNSEVSEASDIIDNAEGYIDETFGNLEESAIDTGILKSMVIQIAYDYAKLNNKDGRISEQDFKKGVEILLAGGVKSKEAIIRNADRLMGDAIKRLETSYSGFSISEGLEKGNKYQSLVDNVMGNYENALSGSFDNTNQDNSTVGGSIVIDLDTL